MMLEGETKTFELPVDASCRKSRKANLALGDDAVSSISFELTCGDFLVNGHGIASLRKPVFKTQWL
jgi:hypothetical protein